jgi:replication-associated recombination protein RarA
MFNSKPIIIQGIDLLDLIDYITRKNKKSQAIVLSQLEEILGRDSKEYSKVRKIFLDTMNDYHRSILTTIFGDIEQAR